MSNVFSLRRLAALAPVVASLAWLTAPSAVAQPAATAQASPPAIVAPTVAAATTPDGVTHQTSIEGITEYRLDNGLRVLLLPDTAKPTVTVNMTYLVGARHENYGQTGMAHLLEHMLFRGTPTLRNALAEFSRRGLHANGSTTDDRTNYYASFAADAGQLEWFLRWQADAMVNALIDPQDLQAEMPVVRNEMEEGENSPFRVLLQRMQAAAYEWHSYMRSVIGARSDVENVDVAQLRDFYHTYYQPDNAVLIVTGQFDPDATLTVIRDAFSGIARPTRTLPREYTVEPVQDGEHRVTVRRQGGTPLTAAMYHGPAQANEDSAALELAVAMLSDVPAGPLYRQLVDQRLATGTFGFMAAQHDPGYLVFAAQLEAGMAPDATLQRMTDLIETWAAQPLQQADLDRVRNKWNTDWRQTIASPERMASLLSEAVAAGDWRLAFLHRDRIASATLQDVQRTASAYLVASNRTEGLYLPTQDPVRAPLPPTVDLAAQLQTYQGSDAMAQLDAFDATPANIDAATLLSDEQLTHGRLRMALLPKPTRANQVQAVLRLRFGDADSLRGQAEAADAAAALLDHGLQQMTRQQVEDRFTALQTDVGFGGSAGIVEVQLSSVREHLPQALALALDVLRTPSFPQEELEKYQRAVLASLENARTQPGSLASQALARHDNPWPQDDVRYVPSFDEAAAQVQGLRRKDVVAFHQRFYGAGDVLFSAVGDFDTQAVADTLRAGLSSWRASPPYVRLDDPYRDVPPARFALDTPGKANAVYLAQMPLALRDTDPEYAAMTLANYLLGGSPTSRLWNRVRVQDGLSYSVGSSLSASAYDDGGSFSINAIFAPQNRQKLEQAIEEELDRARQHGFTPEEVRDGIQALLNTRKLGRAQDGVLARRWQSFLPLDRTFAWSAEQDRRIAALDADQVNAALRRLLDTPRMSIAVAADPQAVPQAD